MQSSQKHGFSGARQAALGAALLVLFSYAVPLHAQYFVIEDQPEFDQLVADNSRLTQLETDLQFAEGPVWIPRGRGFLIFSDIPANELKQWTAEDGVSVFRKPSGNANGNALDAQGRLLSAEHGNRRISVTEADGTVHTLADRFEGKRFNSPNDLAVKSDGTIWFTDPDYGVAKEAKELPGNFVFRLETAKGQLTVLAKDFERPNGICFSPEEDRLYVADSGQPRHIRVFALAPNGTPTGDREFCRIEKGAPDGIRCDANGRLFVAAGDGVHIYHPDGHRLGKFMMRETPANLAFGGLDGRTLFITARTSLYAIRLNTRAPYLPQAKSASHWPHQKTAMAVEPVAKQEAGRGLASAPAH